ncbi:MAG: serine/threonine-protein kinase [Gaiellaceae bacterium]
MEVGRYRVLEVLGEGASAVVYRATDGSREVAVKLLRDPSAEALRRFEREARLAATIESRHLVRVLEVGDRYLVLPLYAGTLAERVRSHGALPVAEVVALAAEVAQGLDALHERGVLHRDVKPSNVLLDDAGSAALSDFGLARGADSTQLTRDGQLVGTAHYLAPELIEGAPATVASDVYAFGCLLYECLTGAPPFGGRDDAEVGFAHLVEPPPDPRTRRPELSADTALALLTALAKDERSRPTSATALARMLHLSGRRAPA